MHINLCENNYNWLNLDIPCGNRQVIPKIECMMATVCMDGTIKLLFFTDQIMVLEDNVGKCQPSARATG